MTIEIRMTATGDADVLKAFETSLPLPGPDEIRLRQHAVGVSFIDIYHRRGLYPLPDPRVPGVEGAGIVEAVGANVRTVRVGDRVAYAGAPGGYAATRLLPAWRVVPLPDDVSFETAASSMLRGLTAHMLLSVSFPVGSASRLLVHAAAAGSASC